METILALIMIVSLELNVPPNFVKAIAYTEHWNGSIENTIIKADRVSKPNFNGSVDRGVMQLNSQYFDGFDWADPETNIRKGIEHIAYLSKHCSTYWHLALAYNAGLGGAKNPPASSLTYADRVMQIYLELEGTSYIKVKI